MCMDVCMYLHMHEHVYVNRRSFEVNLNIVLARSVVWYPPTIEIVVGAKSEWTSLNLVSVENEIFDIRNFILCSRSKFYDSLYKIGKFVL